MPCDSTAIGTAVRWESLERRRHHIPLPRHRFACFDLFHSPIHLVTSPTALVSRLNRPSSAEIGTHCHIATFPFNPRPQKQFIHGFFAHHFMPSDTHKRGQHPGTDPVYFANSLMLKALATKLT